MEKYDRFYYFFLKINSILKEPRLNTIICISFLQYLLALTLLNFVLFISGIIIQNLNRIITISIAILLGIIIYIVNNIYFYSNKRYEQIEKRYESLNKSQLLKGKTITFIIIFSILALFFTLVQVFHYK